jgi:hypothetical protein
MPLTAPSLPLPNCITFISNIVLRTLSMRTFSKSCMIGRDQLCWHIDIHTMKNRNKRLPRNDGHINVNTRSQLIDRTWYYHDEVKHWNHNYNIDLRRKPMNSKWKCSMWTTKSIDSIRYERENTCVMISVVVHWHAQHYHSCMIDKFCSIAIDEFTIEIETDDVQVVPRCFLWYTTNDPLLIDPSEFNVPFHSFSS